jgi:hypothetical protein
MGCPSSAGGQFECLSPDIGLPKALPPPLNGAALFEYLGGFFGLPDGKYPTKSVTLTSNGAGGAVSA